MTKKIIHSFSKPMIVAISAALLASCSGGGRKADTKFVARDVNTLYNAAKERLDNQNYEVAAALFDEVERQHPFSPWSRRAQLMGAFSYYLDNKYDEAIRSASRFLSIHPGNKDAPYAYYLIAMCHYERISDVTRDQKTTSNALAALGEVQRRYPNTRYAADAGLKIDLVRDHLAGKEMEIGRFYQRRSLWLASVIRFREVIDRFDTTTHTEEALYRLTESYLALGVLDEAKRSASVLGNNYPGSEWYEKAFKLMEKHTPEA